MLAGGLFDSEPGPHGTPTPGPSAPATIESFGRYTLIKQIAKGGMAEIWLARQGGPGGYQRFLVVKRILAHLSHDEKYVAMFLDEARTSALLNHPNVVQVYDFGQVDNRFFMAMELMLGENLSAISWRATKRARPFPIPLAARVIADACRGLHYAHTRTAADGRSLDIVHRDVSPQNIVVTYEGETKLVDFGIAKSADRSEETQTGILKGKLSYLSPEQCLHQPVDHRADVFAAGIVLYELLTGMRLFRHEAELVVLQMIATRDVEPPSSVRPDIPRELDVIVMRALAKDPARRFSTAGEMQFALERLLGSQSESELRRKLAEYLGALFADNVAKKRMLLEDASSLRLEPRRRTVVGPSPSQMPTPPVPAPVPVPVDPRVVIPPPHATGSPGMSPPPPGFYEALARGQVVPHPATGTPVVFVERPTNPWPSRLLVALALVVIVVASSLIVQQLLSRGGPTTIHTTPAQPLPVRTGKLALESVPAGAHVYLDGTQLLADGAPAVTPLAIDNLVFDTPYELRFVLPHHEPETINVVMSERSNGKVVSATLLPRQGRLRVEVLSRHTAGIYVDDERIGFGPLFDTSMPSGRPLHVEARHRGLVCTTDPETVVLAPERLVTVQVRCEPRKKHRRRTRETPDGAQDAACKYDPRLPKGVVHITSKPYAEIFFEGRSIGTTPAGNLRLPAGCVTLELVTKAGERTTREIEVKPGLVSTHRLAL